MKETVVFKSIVDAYTDFLVQEFVSFLDAPVFNGQTFLEVFSDNLENISLRKELGLNEEAFQRLIQAFVSVKALSVKDGKLLRENKLFGDTMLMAASDKVFGKDTSFAEDDKKFQDFLNHDLINSQLEEVGSLKNYLIDSITYDVLVVRRFLSPKATFEVLHTGASVAASIFNLTSNQIFDHYIFNPRLLNVYGHGFASSHFMSDLDFIPKISFQESDEIVDIGGCFGNLGRIILETTDQNVNYSCLDLGGVLQAFSSEIKESRQKFGDRFKFIEGDFFNLGDEITGIEGRTFQKLFLGWILHDWNDDQCIQVLKKCSKHMDAGSELIIFEILPNGRKMAFNFTDWLMLSMADGFERSLAQYQVLFERSGLELMQTEYTSTGRSMMRLRIKHG